MTTHNHTTRDWSAYSPPIRALLDEYARAIRDFDAALRPISAERYHSACKLSNKSFPDMRAILKHVISAGHVYADYIAMAISGNDPGGAGQKRRHDTPVEALESVWGAFDAMVDVLAPIQNLDEDAMDRFIVKTRWNVDYTLDQMLEHAIVHILRHRRQIERWL